LCKTDSIGSKLIEARGKDLPAETTGVGKSKVIGHDNYNIGLTGLIPGAGNRDKECKA
jgi:hypothetical protein